MTCTDSKVLREIKKEGVTYRLVTPSAYYESSFRQYISELGEEERYPFVLDLKADDFANYLVRLTQFRDGINIPKGYVDSSTFWLVSDNTLLGVSNLRHRLNKEIAHVGGHIGLGIRPSARGKKLSRLLLAWTCEMAREKGIGEPPNNALHIHCYSHNVPSKRMIESVGGQLHSTVEDGDSSVSRYVFLQTPVLSIAGDC
jgi:predicted acetyltransferase